MSEFEAKTLAILGRQPQLGLAELERLYGGKHVRPLAGAALLDIDIENIEFRRLGGTIKLAKVLDFIPSTSWSELVDYLKTTIPEHLKYVPSGSFTLGLSVYGVNVKTARINADMLAIKKLIRQSGRPVRIVPNKSTSLNSAQVLHNKLTSKGAWELLFVRDGERMILAQSIFVQDIEAYSARDQARPARDARIGMLPPKLAQMMINLGNPHAGGVILDPFCGSGVVLQEALLMGYHAVGSDIEKRMVEYAKANMEWLSEKYDLPKGMYQIVLADATKHEWLGDIDAVISETHLGTPLKLLPEPYRLKQITNDVNQTLLKFLLNLSQQLKKAAPLVIAVPAWRRPNGELIRLGLIDQLTDMGYTYLDLKHVRRDELIYFRENQIVARELLVLRKS